MSYYFQYYMGHTSHGEYMHITRPEDNSMSLCGHHLIHLVRKFGTQELVPYADYHTTQGNTCQHCLEEYGKHLAADREKPQARII